MSENRLPHILVVEDEAIVAMQITKTLRRLGYTTTSVATGEDAIQTVKAENPDLALMDIMLAGEMDGIQTAAYLSRHHGTPIVYLTANADESTIGRAKLTEPYGYILKPFQEARLRKTIDVALQRHGIAKRMKEGGSFLPALETVEDAVYTSDASGRLIYLNLAGETLIASKLEQVRGTHLADLFKGLKDDHKKVLREGVAETIQTGTEMDLSSQGIEISSKGALSLKAHSLVPIGPSKDQITGVVLVIRGVHAGSSEPMRAPSDPSAEGESAKGQKTTFEVTGLPARPEAEKAIDAAFKQATHRYAVVLVLDRFDLIRHRFGLKAAQEVLLFYSIHLAQSMGPTDLLFQWSGPNFIMLLDRPAAVTEVRREISSWAGVRLEKMIEATSHSAMLVVSGKWRMFETVDNTSPEALIAQIDEYTGAPAARQPVKA